MIDVVTAWIIDKSNNKGIFAFSKYGIAFISGILYKITKTKSPNTDIKKKSIDINIDCNMWYIKNFVTVFLANAAIINHTKPTPPAVRYVAAERSLSIGYGLLEIGNDILFSVFC